MPFDQKVKDIQISLNTKLAFDSAGYKDYPLAEDGLIGPKTCGTLYEFQNTMGFPLAGDSTIALETLQTIDSSLTQAHLNAVVNKCKVHRPGGGGSASGPVVDTGSGTINAGVSSKSPVLPLILGGLIGGGIGYLGHKQGFIKKGTAQIGAGVGAAAGALTFWFLGKKG